MFPLYVLTDSFFNDSFFLNVEVHTIFAVQFTEMRAVAEARVPETNNYIAFARTSSSINDATVSTCNWEYLTFSMEMAEFFDLNLLPFGNLEVRVTMVLHGRLGDVKVDHMTRQVPVRDLNTHVSDENFSNFDLYDNEYYGGAATPVLVWENEEVGEANRGEAVAYDSNDNITEDIQWSEVESHRGGGEIVAVTPVNKLEDGELFEVDDEVDVTLRAGPQASPQARPGVPPRTPQGTPEAFVGACSEATLEAASEVQRPVYPLVSPEVYADDAGDSGCVDEVSEATATPHHIKIKCS
ncbi:hypothetical protein SBRCBS47491_007482 [Sporothrix bragantina]|uniref:Uncharacterized protein n=1 Tax=Sporothrix bragantina TaxID=671064 RepID=A0ABP0CDL6_9PEZI